MSRAQLTSTVEQNTGGAVAPFVAGKNKIINGDFGIWQRGTSLSLNAAVGYGADRWYYYFSPAGTISRVSTGDTTNLPNIQYAARIQRNSGNTTTLLTQISQSFETNASIPLAGKTVTLSFYARAGANYSSTSNGLTLGLNTGTGTDQNVQNGYTGQSTPIAVTATLTTTWQRFSYTNTLSSSLTELGVFFGYNPTGTAGANDYFDITGVQVEVGSVATPFTTASGTLQGELALAQRYFQKSYSQNVSVPTNSNSSYYANPAGAAIANGSVFASVLLLATMRTAPTVTIYSYTSSTTGAVSSGSGTDLTAGSGTIYASTDAHFSVYNNSGAPITGANGMFIFHYAASAEL
jgi:hypothetical protein